MTVVNHPAADIDLVFNRSVIPVVFPSTTAGKAPTLTLLHNPVGSGGARSTAHLAVDALGQAVLSAADLRAFHPGADDASATGAEDPDFAATVADWFGACLAYAREHRRSLLIEGAFLTPAVAVGTAKSFAEAGFATRVAVVASSRRETLISTVSQHLAAVRSRRTAPLPTREARDRGWESTGALVSEVAESTAVHRIQIFGRTGGIEADVTRSSSGAAATAKTTLAAAQARPFTALQAVQWLSELRRMTDFVESRRQPMVEVREALVELHVLAIREVVAALPVPAGSEVIAREEGRLASELIRLRRSIPTPPRPDATGPVVAGPGRGPEGPSR